MKLTATIITFWLLGASVGALAQDANTLLTNMDKVIFGPSDKQGNVKIILSDDQSGSGRIREAIMMQKGTDKKLYRYTKPENQAGIATLSLPGDIMWLYMPAFGKPKKISFLAKSGAFNGTDFSYEDMATTPYADRFDPELLETNDQAYVLQLIPKTEKSQYSKILVSIDKAHYYPIFMQFFNQGGQKFKEATYTYQKTGKYWNASEVLMVDLRKEHSTRIQLSDIKFDQGLDDELFTVENLEQ